MPDQPSKDSPSFLIHLAAEGLAPVIPGCVGVLAAGARGSNGIESPQLKAIAYFGSRITARWLAELGPLPRAEQIEQLTRVAGLRTAVSASEASAAVEQYAPGATPDEKTLAVEYLTTIPLSVRRSLVPDPSTGRPTLYPTLPTDAEQAFLRLLPVDVPPFPLGTVLPNTSYQLEELLGMGGFGAVYRATNRFEQNQPPRAIKFCLDASLVATLHRERAILDRLMTVAGKKWSPRIVRLYGYALDVQPPFLVYEYVPGGDLTSYLTATRQKTGRGFRPAVVLELVRQIAEALAFAHGQGLVHRDLKPANILVSGAAIKLTDFGIGGVVASHAARGGLGGQSNSLTAATQASFFRGSGTPLYMSAEQRRGEQPDPRHDLYSLGVVWYQLLVGDVTRELHPGWLDELVEEFQAPREHIDLIQRCVGYLKKRPADAGQLLALLRATGSISDTPPPGLTPAPGTEYGRLKAALADQIDHDALHKARETVAALLCLQPTDPETLAARAFIRERLAAQPSGELLCLREHQGWVRAVALAPDGRLALSAGDDRTVRLWDLGENRELHRLTGHTAAVMSVALTPDGRRALSGSWDGSVRLWDLGSGTQLLRLAGAGKTVKTVAVTPDGRRALSAGDDKLLHLWDLETGGELFAFAGHTDAVQSVAISSDGRFAVSGGDDHTIRLWDLDAGMELRRFVGHADSVTGVALAPDGRWLASASSDTTVRLWAAAGGQELRRLSGHSNWVNAVAISADGRRLLTGSGGEMRNGRFQDGLDTTMRLWDAETGRELHRFAGHVGSVTSVALARDLPLALSGSLDKTVRVWELP